jgi:ribulose-phosphate 3-epimerase
MKKNAFLALDIGTNSVRGFGAFWAGAKVSSHLHSESGGSPAQNIANAIDVIEDKLGVKFKDAFITGNFGTVRSFFGRNTVAFGKLHKIADSDVRNAIFNSKDLDNLHGRTTLHLIPVQFLIDNEHEITSTDNISCHSLFVRFHYITYPDEIIRDIKKGLWAACFPANNFFDPIYLLSQTYKNAKKESSRRPVLFIDFGKTSTKAGVCKNRGLVSRFDIEAGQDDVTKNIAYEHGLTDKAAEDIKIQVLNSAAASSDQYVLADAKYPNLTKHDVREIWFEVNNRIVDAVLDKVREAEFDVFITGHNANTDNINSLILKNKGIDATVLDEFAIAGSFGEMFKKNFTGPGQGAKKIKAFGSKPKRAVPIIPSVMCWPIGGSYVYEMFRMVGIKALHMDMMDGFYTNKVFGTLIDLATVRRRTKLHIQAHLMVEDPMLWIEPALKAGADSIIISSGTSRVIESLKTIKEAGKRCGVAIHPDFDLKKLKPELLTMLNDIMVMAVVPGASGQKFLPGSIRRIKTLYNTREKYGFKYKIIVDGGINDEVAADCWKAGADFLVSGNFLRKAPDFADAVLKLL